MGKLVCPYCRTEATDAIGVKRREPRQKHYVFGMAEPYYMHSEGVPYSKKDTFKPKGGGKNPPACSPVSAGSSSTPSNGRSIAAPVTPWLQMPTAPEMCSSHSHGFGLRPTNVRSTTYLLLPLGILEDFLFKSPSYNG